MNTVIERNHVRVIGEGHQIIVMAHGFGCDQNMWQYITPYFKEQYKIVLFDYVGSGKSDMSAYDAEKYNSLHGYKQDLLEVIEALDLEQVIYFGHSVSSMIGLLAAIEQPQKFKQMIMIGPSPCYLNDEHYKGGFEKSDVEDLLSMMEMNFAGWASFMAPFAMGNEGTSPITEELENTFVSCNPQIAKQFAEVTFYSDYRDTIAKLQVPTLIMQCANDSVVPVEVGYYLHKNIKNSELVILDTRGHYPHISEPKLTVELMNNYLQIK